MVEPLPESRVVRYRNRMSVQTLRCPEQCVQALARNVRTAVISHMLAGMDMCPPARLMKSVGNLRDNWRSRGYDYSTEELLRRLELQGGRCGMGLDVFRFPYPLSIEHPIGGVRDPWLIVDKVRNSRKGKYRLEITDEFIKLEDLPVSPEVRAVLEQGLVQMRDNGEPRPSELQQYCRKLNVGALLRQRRRRPSPIAGDVPNEEWVGKVRDGVDLSPLMCKAPASRAPVPKSFEDEEMFDTTPYTVEGEAYG